MQTERNPYQITNPWPRRIIIAFALSVALFGCSPLRHYEAVAKDSPRSEAKRAILAPVCAVEFPIRDSAGKVNQDYKPADNTNYQGQIDSLQNLINELIADAATQAYSAAMAPTAPGEIKPAPSTALQKVAQAVNKLKETYKPCIPDTVFQTQTIYRENTARVVDLQNQVTKLAELLKQKTIEADDYKHKALVRLIGLVALIALIGVGIYLKTTKII